METEGDSGMFDLYRSNISRSSLAKNNPCIIREIVISKPKWYHQGYNPFNGHRVFTIKTYWNEALRHHNDSISTVERRYGHFVWLREKLLEKYPYEPIPILPQKDWLMTIERDDSEKVRDRMLKLQYFLTIIVTNSILSYTDEVQNFLDNIKDEFYEKQYLNDMSKSSLSDVIVQTQGNIWSIGSSLMNRISFTSWRKTEAPTNEEMILQRMKKTLDCLNLRYQNLVEGINKELEFKKQISGLQAEFGSISGEINNIIKIHRKEQDSKASAENRKSYLETLIRINPMKEVSQKDKEFIKTIHEALDVPLAVCQVLIISMYECLSRVEQKTEELKDYTEILDQNVDMKKRQSNEFKYENPKFQLEEEIKKNFPRLFNNFERIRNAIDDLVFEKIIDEFIIPQIPHLDTCRWSMVDS